MAGFDQKHRNGPRDPHSLTFTFYYHQLYLEVKPGSPRTQWQEQNTVIHLPSNMGCHEYFSPCSTGTRGFAQNTAKFKGPILIRNPVPIMETSVSTSKTPVSLWSLEGVRQQSEIEKCGTSGAARCCQWKYSHKRQKQ